jgi:hypothetical protein
MMLGAVVAIEKSGINKESVSLFRKELKSVISIVSKHVRKKCLVRIGLSLRVFGMKTSLFVLIVYLIRTMYWQR